LGRKVNFWLGLVGHANLIYAAILGGSAATVFTTVVAYGVSFLDFVSGTPLFFRMVFYGSVFILSFALINHGQQRLANWRTRQGGPSTVSRDTEIQEQRAAPVDEQGTPLDQRSRTELKEPCIALSQELFTFVSERDKEDPVSTTWIADADDAELNEYSHKSSQYMSETMDLYDQQYSGRVMSLFEALEHRGLWNPERLDPEERKHVQDPGTPYDIRKIARQLSRVGHKLDAALSQSDYEINRAENEGSGTEAELTNEGLVDEKGREHIEDLKRCCRELADELRQFLEDNENFDKEQTMRLYNRRLADKASALLEELEEQGLYPPPNLKSYQLAANAKPLSPFAIRNLARTLGIIGHKR
jgi:hypothetical protein